MSQVRYWIIVVCVIFAVVVVVTALIESEGGRTAVLCSWLPLVLLARLLEPVFVLLSRSQPVTIGEGRHPLGQIAIRSGVICYTELYDWTDAEQVQVPSGQYTVEAQIRMDGQTPIIAAISLRNGPLSAGHETKVTNLSLEGGVIAFADKDPQEHGLDIGTMENRTDEIVSRATPTGAPADLLSDTNGQPIGCAAATGYGGADYDLLVRRDEAGHVELSIDFISHERDSDDEVKPAKYWPIPKILLLFIVTATIAALVGYAISFFV